MARTISRRTFLKLIVVGSGAAATAVAVRWPSRTTPPAAFVPTATAGAPVPLAVFTSWGQSTPAFAQLSAAYMTLP